MPTRASRLAVAIAADLAAAGVDQAATQIQGWIDRGWLGVRRRVYPGGGGSSVELAPDAIAIAAAISCLPRRERTATNVVLARFVRGLPVGEGELREAFSAAVAEFFAEADMSCVAGADDDTVAFHAEERAAGMVTRRRRPTFFGAWEPGLRSWADSTDDEEMAGLSTTELLTAAVAPFLAALSGDATHLEGGLVPLAAAVGLLPAMDDLAEPGWGRLEMLDEAAKKVMALVEDSVAVAADVTTPEVDAARRIQVAMLRHAAADVVDLVEGRVNHPWGYLHHTFALLCLTWIINARRGYYDLRLLLERLEADAT